MSKIYDIHKLSTKVRVIPTCFTLALLMLNSNIQAMNSDSEADDSKSHISSLKTKRKEAKIAARDAAKAAAEEASISMIDNKVKAKALIAREKSKSKKDQDLRETRYYGFVANSIIQKSQREATKAALDILHDENEAIKIVNSFRLYRYSNKSNPKGKGSPLVNESTDKHPNLITLGDINNANSIEEKERREAIHLQVKLLRKQVKAQGVDSPPLSHKNVAKTMETAEEVVKETIPIVGHITRHILPLIP